MNEEALESLKNRIKGHIERLEEKSYCNIERWISNAILTYYISKRIKKYDIK